jgi:hypothetical protein
MTKSDTRAKRPISMPRRQIWDLEPEEAEAVASQAVVTDRTYLPDADARFDEAPEPEAEASDGDEASDDMASRALRALEKAEKQLEARGIPASALYEGERRRPGFWVFTRPIWKPTRSRRWRASRWATCGSRRVGSWSSKARPRRVFRRHQQRFEHRSRP